MAKRYSIMVREYQSDELVELCECDSNPESVVEGVRSKTLLIAGNDYTKSRRIRVPKYEHIEIVDHQST